MHLRRSSLSMPTWRGLASSLSVGLVAVLAGCQVIPQPSIPTPKLAPDQSAAATAQRDSNVQVAGATVANTLTSTATVTRAPAPNGLQVSGRVAPARTAALTLGGSGTVSGLDVAPGQSVQQGAPLVEFALDDASLQSARTQATMAELTYETERDKLTTLQAGASSDAVAQQKATIERDQAAIQKIQQGQAAAKQAADATSATRASAKDEADRKVQLAQVALRAAQDTLTAAQATAKRAQDGLTAAQVAAKAEADSAVKAATTATHAADRQVQEATIKLAQAKMEWSTTKASQAVESQQLHVQQDQDAIKDAHAAQQAAATGTAAQQAAADGAVQSVQRALAADTLELQHLQKNLDAARTVDQSDIKLATLALDAANEQAAQAQAQLQDAQQRAQQLAKQPVPAAAGQAQQDPETAQAAVAQAQHAVETAQLNLQDAQAAAQAAATAASNTGDASVPDDPDLTAAQAQLTADQAKLNQLTAGASAAELKAAQARVDVLRQQAQMAAAAAQPIVQLTAPFDGTVTDVGVQVGQTIAPIVGAIDGTQTGADATAGQTTDGRPVAVRLVANGASSVVANVHEADVAQLEVGQEVQVTFPGAAGETATGTLADIASTAAPRTSQDAGATYPVRIDLPSLPPGVRLGMSADITVSRGDASPALVVPRTALRSAGGRTVVTTIDGGGQPHDTPVQVGRTLGSGVEVLSGVNEGDTVAVYEPTTVAARAQSSP